MKILNSVWRPYDIFSANITQVFNNMDMIIGFLQEIYEKEDSHMIRNKILQLGIVSGLCLLAAIFFTVSAAQETPNEKIGTPAFIGAMVKGPYTVHILSEGVYRIEDANESNPAGIVTDEDGKMVHMNNCSDMYLVTGENKALLIDLSNDVQWDDTAAESLRSIVYERVGERDFFITVTHKHGDHLGMLPAFAGDAGAHFWIPEAEFTGTDLFPGERTAFFPMNGSMDLGGGFIIDTIEVPGHTDHSTVFFLKNKNFAFTGDAVGSGSGVWLFNYESFFAYRDGIENLIAYLEYPANGIDPDKLEIHGGHAWQRGNLEKLTARYVYDMRTLIEKMGLGIAESEAMSAPISFLDTNFKYGTATITWNKAAAEKYAKSISAE
jgi:hydroxyacylglutathione hydrolase